MRSAAAPRSGPFEPRPYHRSCKRSPGPSAGPSCYVAPTCGSVKHQTYVASRSTSMVRRIRSVRPPASVAFRRIGSLRCDRFSYQLKGRPRCAQSLSAEDEHWLTVIIKRVPGKGNIQQFVVRLFRTVEFEKRADGLVHELPVFNGHLGHGPWLNCVVLPRSDKHTE